MLLLSLQISFLLNARFLSVIAFIHGSIAPSGARMPRIITFMSILGALDSHEHVILQGLTFMVILRAFAPGTCDFATIC